MLEQSEYGYLADVQWLYRFIEKRDATLRALVARRTSAIKKLHWKIRMKEGVEDDPKLQSMAEQQEEALSDVYEGIDNLRETFAWLALAEFRGFSILEKHYSGDGDIVHLEPVPQWYWTKPPPYVEYRYNSSALNTSLGVEIDLNNFIIRECASPIDEIAVTAFIRKNLSQKDWDGYVETYGLPPLFIELPHDVPVSQIDTYQDIAEKIIGDGRGVLPNGAKVTNVGDASERHGGGERNVFHGHIKYQDEQVVLAGTGGKLTMLNDPTGLGSGQSDSHENTFNDLAVAEAYEIAECCFNKQLTAQFLQRMFPAQEALVEFCIVAPDDDDIAKLTTTVKDLYAAGLEADPVEVGQKTGLKLTRIQKQETTPGQKVNQDGTPVIPPVIPPVPGLKNRSAAEAHLETRAHEAFAKALDSEMSVLRERLKAINSIDDIEVRNAKLRKLQDELPKLLLNMNKSPDAAKVLAEAMTAALFNGIEESVTR